jgi:hypothetical protein
MASVARMNSSRDPVRSARSSSHGIRRTPPTSMSTPNSTTLPRVTASVTGRLPSAPPVPPSDPRQRGQQDQREDHHEVLHDQPADGEAPVFGRELAALDQRVQQDHRARNGQREPEHQRPTRRESPQRSSAKPRAVANATCPASPGITTRAPPIRSASEKWPTPNIGRITPISASCSARTAPRRSSRSALSHACGHCRPAGGPSWAPGEAGLKRATEVSAARRCRLTCRPRPRR